jgi:hypothetical protein
LRATGYLGESDDTLIQEAADLVKIVAKIIHNAQQGGTS